jgi:hypothetical protein
VEDLKHGSLARPQAFGAFAAEDEDELALKVGDVVAVLSDEHPDWWVGRLNGETGHFPSNHVRELEAADADRVTHDDVIVQFTTQALEPFATQAADELGLAKGAVVEVLSAEVGAEWWVGRIGEDVGHFPANHVDRSGFRPPADRLLDDDGDTADELEVLYTAEAIEDFDAEEDDEISLAVGDVIDVVSDEDPDWWVGRLKGLVGHFPSNHVECFPEGGVGSEAAGRGGALPNVLEVLFEAEALDEFKAEEADEIGFGPGDVIEVLAADDSDWWIGRVREHGHGHGRGGGHVGPFPANHVERITVADDIEVRGFHALL